MRKNRLIQWLALLLTGALLLGFAACKSKVEPPTTEPPTTDWETTTEEPTTPASAAPGFWIIELRGIPNYTSFSSEDAQYLPKVQVEMTTTNLETGLSVKNTYGGVTLRSLLSFYGVQAVVSVTVASITGASAVYNDAMAMAEDTILAWELDGAPIDAEPPLRMCPKSGSAELLIRQVSSINVVPGVPEVTQPSYAVTYAPPPMGNNQGANNTTTTRRTTWPTYDPSDPNVEPPTAPTTEPTTTVATTTTTTRTYTSYVYTAPSTVSRTTTTVRPTLEPPEWWPPDVPYYG